MKKEREREVGEGRGRERKISLNETERSIKTFKAPRWQNQPVEIIEEIFLNTERKRRTSEDRLGLPTLNSSLPAVEKEKRPFHEITHFFT